MKKQICLLLFILITISAFAQITFPGLSEAQKQQLLNTKIAMPLPTWIPDGYSVSNIVTKTGKSIKIENKVLIITYGKKLNNGHTIEFKIDAGFDGIGDLPYEGNQAIKSKVGNIYLYYEPFDEDADGKKIKQYGLIMTEWFDIKNLAFDVVFNAQSENEKITGYKKRYMQLPHTTQVSTLTRQRQLCIYLQICTI